MVTSSASQDETLPHEEHTVEPAPAQVVTPPESGVSQPATADEADDEGSSAPSGSESSQPESLHREPRSVTVTREQFSVSQVKVHCWHLPVTFANATESFLVDSGSEVTIIRNDIFKRESALHQKLLGNPGWKILGIAGNEVNVYGVAMVPIKIGNREYPIEALIADIGAPGIIGMNFLLKYNVSTNFHTGEFTLDGETHFLTQDRKTRSFHVRVAKTTVIPPYSEAVLATRPYRAKRIAVGRPFVAQPTDTFSQDTGLVMGGCLVTSHPDKIPVLVVNPTDSPVTLQTGQIAATCVPASTYKLAVCSMDPKVNGHPILPASTEQGNGDVADCPPSATPLAKLQGTGNPPLPPHLEQMVPTDRLTQAQQSEVRSLLSQYPDVFVGPDGSLGRTTIARHQINLLDNRPFKQGLRRAALAHQEVIDKEIQKMLDANVIEPCDSPWASPVVMVKKKDGSWRFCVDYRKLNDMTRKDSYPLPHIDDTFDTLAGSKYFCALDLASGYWQVEVEEKDRPKTAFVTKQGLHQFRVMPFGLCNAPATFERLMELVLKGYLWKRCMVYIDDVVVFGTSFEQTLTNLQLVLERLRGAGLKLKPAKCNLFASEILYLGFVVSGEGIRPDPSKVESVRNWPRPCNVADVRSFLGFASYHRRFIKGFAEIARPLNELTVKTADFVWGPRQEQAFLDLRHALYTAPVLSHPRPHGEFILDTDASNYASGGVLSQVVDGKEQVIAFASVALNPAQMNYCTTHRELLAVVTMTRRFRHYLLGRHFKLRTDHSSLRWLLNYKDVDGMLARWLVKLQEFDMEIEHRPGRLHGNADGLSRCHKCKNPDCPGAYRHDQVPDSSSDSELNPPDKPPALSETPKRKPSVRKTAVTRRARRHRVIPKIIPDSGLEEGIPSPGPTLKHQRPSVHHKVRVRANELDLQLEHLSWLGGYTQRQIKDKQRADPALKPIILAMEEKRRPEHPRRFTFCEETQTLASRWDQLRLCDGLLYRRAPLSNNRTVMQLVLPSALRTEVLHQLHDLRVVGHLGVQRTVSRVQQRFYWPGCSLDVARWCAACPQCASRKGKPGPGRHPMTTVQTGAPFERLAMDILDTHQPTPTGYRYILVISDYFTKWTDAIPLRRHTAHDVAKALITRFIVYFGVPKQIHSDQGTEFESQLFRSLVTMLGSSKIRTSPYRPQSDGQVERFNRSILQMLSAFVCDRANDWCDHLPYVMMAYRSSVHSSTGCTPHMMVHGREQNLPVDIMYPTLTETGPPPRCAPEYVEWIRRAMASAYNFARAHLDKSAIRQKRGYDAHAKERPAFNEGDKVRYYYPPLKQGNKFARPWIGPFTVQKKVTDVDYRIRRDDHPDRILVTHIDNLKPYEGPISLDFNLQRPPEEPEDPMGLLDHPPDQRFPRFLGMRPDSDPAIFNSLSEEDDRPPPRRTKRQKAGQAPKRFGWD